MPISVEYISANPFRALGVYANSTARDVVALKSRMKAYARIGQPLELPVRLEHCRLLRALPAATDEAIRRAEAELSLPGKRAEHALFWFERQEGTGDDDEIMALLDQGHSLQAMERWAQRTDRAAWKNRLLLALMMDDWDEAAPCLEHCFGDAADDSFGVFMQTVLPHVPDAFSGISFNLLNEIKDGNMWDRAAAELRKFHRSQLETAIDAAQEAKERKPIDLDALWQTTHQLRAAEVHLQSLYGLPVDTPATGLLTRETLLTLWDTAYCGYRNGKTREWAEFLDTIFKDMVQRYAPLDDHGFDHVYGEHSGVKRMLDIMKLNESSSKRGKNDGCFDSIGSIFAYIFIVIFYIFLAKMCGWKDKTTTPSYTVPAYQHYDRQRYRTPDMGEHFTIPIPPTNSQISIEFLEQMKNEYTEKAKTDKEAEKMQKTIEDVLEILADTTVAEPSAPPDSPAGEAESPTETGTIDITETPEHHETAEDEETPGNSGE